MSFPGVDFDPQRKRLINRCNYLDIDLIKKNGDWYSPNTLKSKCLKRKIEGTAIRPTKYKLKKKSNKPIELPRYYEVGDQILGHNGNYIYSIELNSIGRRYWKKIGENPL